MKIKTTELIGTALDWAAAKCEGMDQREWDVVVRHARREVEYSTAWRLGGPIIEREGMGIWMYQFDEHGEPEVGWYAEEKDGDHVRTGPTPLVAAMRCFVASKLGDGVEVPDGLES